MENENFVSWGPEDSERMHRFQKLGYKVEWLKNHIWHLEHPRSENSTDTNPHFWKNNDLYRHLILLPEDRLREYYKNQEYLKKYV
jgi:REP element-mobilizing transposase RayT